MLKLPDPYSLLKKQVPGILAKLESLLVENTVPFVLRIPQAHHALVHALVREAAVEEIDLVRVVEVVQEADDDHEIHAAGRAQRVIRNLKTDQGRGVTHGLIRHVIHVLVHQIETMTSDSSLIKLCKYYYL